MPNHIFWKNLRLTESYPPLIYCYGGVYKYLTFPSSLHERIQELQDVSCSWSTYLTCSSTGKKTPSKSPADFLKISTSSASCLDSHPDAQPHASDPRDLSDRIFPRISSSLYINYLAYYWKMIQILKFEIQVFQGSYNYYTHRFFGFPRHIIGSILAPDFLQKWWKSAPFLNLNLVFEASSSPPAQLLSYHGFSTFQRIHTFLSFLCSRILLFEASTVSLKKNWWFLVS